MFNGTYAVRDLNVLNVDTCYNIWASSVGFFFFFFLLLLLLFSFIIVILNYCRVDLKCSLLKTINILVSNEILPLGMVMLSLQFSAKTHFS